MELAIKETNAILVKALLNSGVSPNESVQGKEKTMLMIAAQSGNVDIIQLLLAAGADKSAKDSNGKTAADFATADECRRLLF